MMRAIIGVAAPINRLAARATTNRLAALRTSTRLLSTKRPFSSEVAVDDASTPPSDAAVLSSLMAGDMPHHRLEAELGDAARAAQLRRLFLEATAAAAGAPVSFEGLPLNGMDTDNFYSSIVGQNCENVVGYVPLPVGIVGPLLVDGRSYQVPLATTEGALIASTNRGARAVSQCGGVTSVLLDDGMTRAPLVACVDLSQAAAMKAYCEAPESLAELQSIFSGSTRFGQLLSVKVALAGRHAYLRFKCATGDAMGMNMVGKGVNNLMAELTSRFPGSELMALSGNYCVDKKPSAVNWIEGRGKSVAAEAVLPGGVVRRVLKADARRLAEVNTYKNLVGSALAGSLGGFNAHASNIVTAAFLACVQDPAQNVESSTCIVNVEATPSAAAGDTPGDDDYDLRIAVTMPSVACGTVGGGTSLPAQKACLGLLGVAGATDADAAPGTNAQQLSRIIASTVLCGELSLLAALSSNHLISAHLALNRKPSK